MTCPSRRPRPSCDIVRAGREAQLAVGDDLLARLDAARDHRVVVRRARDADRPHRDGAIGSDDVDVLALLAVLHGGRRHDDRVRRRSASCSVTWTSSPGHMRRSVFGKVAFSLIVPVAVVDHVVDERHLADRRRLRAAGRAPPSRAAARWPGRARIFGRYCAGHGERHANRRDLIDHDHRRSCRRCARGCPGGPCSAPVRPATGATIFVYCSCSFALSSAA